ncbi:MAG: hypothetical protein WC606_05045 [Candidatus Absconditabacterales bacterium]
MKECQEKGKQVCEKHIQVARNDANNGCAATARNLYQMFTCDICEYKNKWNCVSLIMNDILNQKK